MLAPRLLLASQPASPAQPRWVQLHTPTLRNAHYGSTIEDGEENKICTLQDRCCMCHPAGSLQRHTQDLRPINGNCRTSVPGFMIQRADTEGTSY
jgi:hypothetical protein